MDDIMLCHSNNGVKSKYKHDIQKKKYGFTIIELSVVLIIISLLVTAVLNADTLKITAGCVKSSLGLGSTLARLESAAEENNSNVVLNKINKIDDGQSFVDCIDGFNPKVIDNLSLWLDASDSSDADAITRSGNDVTQWKDKSDLNNHFNPIGTLTVDTHQIGDKNAIYFNNSAYFSGPNTSNLSMSNSDYEVFIVAYPDTNHMDFLISAQSYYHEILLNYLNIGVSFVSINWGLKSTSGSAGSYFNDSYIFNARLNGSDQVISINNIVSTHLSVSKSSSVTPLSIGARADGGYPFLGKIGEVIIYGKALSIKERRRIYNYLSKKWGII